MYVQTILDVHKKYNALVMSAFNNDAGFVASLDKVTLLMHGSVRFTLFRFSCSIKWPLLYTLIHCYEAT